MVKKIIFIGLLLFIGCGGIKRIKLNDGKTEVPESKNYFDKYRGSVDKHVFTKLDTTAYYEFKREYKSKSTDFEEVEQYSWQYDKNRKQYLKFYSSGQMNNFDFSLENNYSFDFYFNPKNSGWRGVYTYNSIEDIIKIKFFRYFASSPMSFSSYDIGILNIKVKGDTLLAKSNYLETVYLYVKNKDLNTYSKYKADW